MTHPPGSHRVRPTAYPLLHLAREAVHGHKVIAERVAEHAAKAVADRSSERAAAAARAAEAGTTRLEPGRGTPNSPGG